MATSLTNRYTPRIEQIQENLFMEEYYSSTDTKIYIDDAEQSEIGYIQYSLQEQLKPLYGYASRTFDDVAIGSRIVTGVLKVPIKNIEKESTLPEVIQRGRQEAVTDYNNSEQDKENAVEWIGDTSVGDTPESQYSPDTEDDKTFEYRTKLIQLGYNIDYNSSLTDLRTAIRQFQEEHNISADGNLTQETMNAIDDAISTSQNKETMLLPPGTRIYLKPILSSDNYTLAEETTVTILSRDYDDGWVYIMLPNGDEGFIKTTYV